MVQKVAPTVTSNRFQGLEVTNEEFPEIEAETKVAPAKKDAKDATKETNDKQPQDNFDFILSDGESNHNYTSNPNGKHNESYIL